MTKWLKMSQIKEGMKVHLDAGFPCITEGNTVIEKDEEGRYYFKCAAGKHLISGQINEENGEEQIGRASCRERVFRAV